MNSESVVKFLEITPHIVQLTMEDRVNKNTFSKELVTGLVSAFQRIESNTNYRAVILTGYDNYFCSGGTQEGLIDLYEGKGRFSDGNLYSLPMDCKIPVISAMQGHGIGGGFVFGMYSDFVVLSRESVYTTNFMKYGFTPGFGSTFILREKLGLPLAQEMLTRANNFRGAELAQRGVPFPVLSRAEVLPYALNLANEIAEKPRNSLIILKDHMIAYCREKLPEFIRQEEEMHDKTFHQTEVKERINLLFGK